MRKFGMSAVVVCVLAAPAWASYPMPYTPEGPPPPAGVPLLPPVRPPPVFPVGFAPDMLPPMGPPGAPAPVPPYPYGPAIDPCCEGATDPCGYPFDPCVHKRKRRGGGIVHGEYWVRGDWLYWDLRDTPIPQSLIVSGNPALPLAGLPGGGNSVPLFDGTRELGAFNGIRATIGGWFDPDGELGVEFTGFVLGREGATDLFVGSPGRTLSVPFQGTDGSVGVYDFSFPGRFAGSLAVRTATQLYGAEATLLHRTYGDGCVSVDALFGYRYLQLIERLDLFGVQNSAGATGIFLGRGVPAGVAVTTIDSFRARTEFHGGQFGARVEGRRGMVTATGFGKLGFGANIQTLRVEGQTQVNGFGITRTAFGGVRALPTNFGRDTNTDFSFLSETGLEVGLQVTKNLSVRVGYNLLFWSDVLRPASVIEPVLSRTQVPVDQMFNAAVPATRPVTVFRSSDFLAHGLVVGVLVEW